MRTTPFPPFCLPTFDVRSAVLQGQLEGAQTEAAAAAAPEDADDASLNPPDIAVLDPSSGDEAIETPKLQASLEVRQRVFRCCVSAHVP